MVEFVCNFYTQGIKIVKRLLFLLLFFMPQLLLAEGTVGTGELEKTSESTDAAIFWVDLFNYLLNLIG